MSLYHKMKLLMKASVEAPMNELVAKNDIQIFEQELCIAEGAIRKAKLHLAQIKTEVKLTQTSIDSLEKTIRQRESQAAQILGKDDDLAREIAMMIVEEERVLSDQSEQLSHLKMLELKTTEDLRAAVKSIANHRQKLGYLKAYQHSLMANSSIKNYSTSIHSSLAELNSSLRSISDRQLRSRLLDESEQQIEQSIIDGGIEHRLKEAGVCSKEKEVELVMQRLSVKNPASDSK